MNISLKYIAFIVKVFVIEVSIKSQNCLLFTRQMFVLPTN